MYQSNLINDYLDTFFLCDFNLKDYFIYLYNHLLLNYIYYIALVDFLRPFLLL